MVMLATKFQDEEIGKIMAAFTACWGGWGSIVLKSREAKNEENKNILRFGIYMLQSAQAKQQ